MLGEAVSVLVESKRKIKSERLRWVESEEPPKIKSERLTVQDWHYKINSI